MPLTAAAARQIAEAWLTAHMHTAERTESFPFGSRLQTCAYNPEASGRLFKVNYRARSLRESLHLADVYVYDDATVRIVLDNRSAAHAAGKETERRFLAALEVRTAHTPRWFLRIQRARSYHDRRGIDAFAFVTYRPGERRLRVPIQIKSSRAMLNLYYERHPAAKKYGVVVIVVDPKKTDDQLRDYVYNVLGRVRKQKIRAGTRFTEFHALLDLSPEMRASHAGDDH